MRLIEALGERFLGRRDFGKQFARYRSTVLWLYKGLMRRFPARTSFAVGANVLGITLRGGALSVLIYYASQMESASVISLMGYEFPTREPGTFIAVTIVLGLLLLLSGALVFAAGRAIIRLALDFAVDCSRTCLQLEHPRAPDRTIPPGQLYPNSALAHSSGLVGIARGVRPLLQISNPLSMLLYSVAVLFYIDTLLTLALSGLVLFSLVFQYIVNFNAAQNQKMLGRAKRRAHGVIKSVMHSAAARPHTAPGQREHLRNELGREEVRELLDRFSFRVLAARYSGLVSDIVLAVAAVALLMHLGLKALSNELPWSHFLGYVIFARLLLTAVRSSLSGITGFARHYPKVRALHEMIESESTSRVEAEPPGRLLLRRRGEPAIGNRRSMQWWPGDPLALITPIPVSRFNAYWFADAVAGRKSTPSETLRRHSVCVPDELDTEPEGGYSAVIAGLRNQVEDPEFIASLEPEVKPGIAASNSGAAIDAASWSELRRVSRSRILLAAVLSTPAHFVLVESRIATLAGPEFVGRWLKHIGKTYVVIRYPKYAEANEMGAKIVLVVAADGSRGLMDQAWCRSHQEHVEDWLSQHIGRRASGQDSDDDDDDE